VLHDTSFASNTAVEYGGEIGGMNGTDIEVDACSFRANAAIGTSGDAYGGAVCISRGTSLVIRSTNFKTNRALSDGGSGGAIEVADGMADNNPVANVEIYDSVFTANTAGDQGGGISLGGSIGPKTTIRGCTCSTQTLLHFRGMLLIPPAVSL
jgi:predicted outer membrane repeat protein